MDKIERKEILLPGDPGFEYFDDEERELIESYERGEWRPIENQEAVKAYFQKVAERTLERLEREKMRQNPRRTPPTKHTPQCRRTGF